jgi:hypothetical protein
VALHFTILERNTALPPGSGRTTAKTRVENLMTSIRTVDGARAMLKLLAEHFNVPPVKLRWLRDKRNRRGEAAGRYYHRTHTIRIWLDRISHETREASTNGEPSRYTMTLDSVLCHEFAHHLAAFRSAELNEINPPHSEQFWTSLRDVAAFWYGDARKYPWNSDYPAAHSFALRVVYRKPKPKLDNPQRKLF